MCCKYQLLERAGMKTFVSEVCMIVGVSYGGLDLICNGLN